MPMRLTAAFVVTAHILTGSVVAQEPEEQPNPVALIGLTAGALTWNGDSFGLLVSLSGEQRWESGWWPAFEVGAAVAGGPFYAFTLTPGMMYNFSPDDSLSPFVRGGFSLVNGDPGFHVGGGVHAIEGREGVRVEGRFHLFPVDGTDFMAELRFTYEIGL
jgi:hypothetical protein